MRLLIIQYGGEYREAYYRLANGGEEIYGFQKYSVDYVANLTEKLEEVTIISICSNANYDEFLKPKLRAIGLGLKQDYDKNKIRKYTEKYIKELKPDRMILRFPSQEILSLAIKYKIPTLASFADYIANKTIKQKIRNFFLANLLNNPNIQWISNHGVYASETLKNIGVKPEKIIPRDWPSFTTPKEFSPKDKSFNNELITVFYCGTISENKGVKEIINAISLLNKEGLNIQAKIAGNGEIEKYSAMAKKLGIEEQIVFLGLISHNKVIPLMRDSDLVIVPSRIEYAEGFPKVINEALVSRTPLIVSNHPVFMSKLKNEQNAMIFRSGDYVALCEGIKKVINNEKLYYKLSTNSYETWLSLQIPCKFHDLINNWLFNEQNRNSFLSQHNLLNWDAITKP